MNDNSICGRCGHGYVMGWNGTEDGCDECLNVVRDSHGHAWFPDEKFHEYMDVSTGNTFFVLRQDALNP